MAAKDPQPASGSSSALVKLVPILVIVALLAGAGYYFLAGGGSNRAPATTAPATATAPVVAPNAAAPATAEPVAPVPDLSPEQLLKEAGAAFREQRYVAPPGNNALEYYLRELEKVPNNQTATDALREMFPLATGAVEQDINAGSVDEATRVINLLAKADPSNYTLTILRSKLDAKKKQTERDTALQTAAAAAAAARTAANNANAAPAGVPAAPADSAQTTAAPPPANSVAATAAPAPTRTPDNATANATRPAAPVTAPAPAAASGGETHPATIVKAGPPDYPPDAARQRLNGWVEVEFTVKADGTVGNATVVNAQPSRVFNAAAVRAVERWTFTPRMENGKATEEQIRRRIEFKL